MTKNILFQLVFLVPFSIFLSSASAQNSSGSVKNEISEALKLFNNAAKNANTDEMLSLFDDSENVMFIGSDSAEIWKGKEQIKGHLNSIFSNESVSLDMNRIDIDFNANTAWVFVDGAIVISLKTGEKIKAPYRFSGVLVKKANLWKWRLFNGSNPGGK
ncbi:MAG: nuclear transport factor 2 family protein [Bacteroidota bacterium]